MVGNLNKSGTANEILDLIMEKGQLVNDAALSRFMEVAPPVISKMRHGKLQFGAVHILRLHEKTEWPVAVIKSYLPVAE